MNLSLGSLYAWSIFIAPLESEFGWNRADTSWIFTIAIVVFGITFVVSGRLQDRFGPLPVSLAGSFCLAAGFILSSFTHSLPSIFLTLGVLLGLGNGFGYATPTPVVSKWFPDKRGLAVGITVAGNGAGSAILGFAAPPLLERYGWRGTLLALGCVYLVTTVVASLLLRNPAHAPHESHEDARPLDMLRTRAFRLMWVAFCCGATAGLMTISQLIPFAKSAGLGAAAATLALLVGAAGNASGRILSGWISDRAGRVRTLGAVTLLSAILMPLLANASGIAAVYALVFAIYFCFGTLLSVFPSTTADFFGTRNLGVNYGWLFTAYTVAGVAGPLIAGYVFRTRHSYTLAFYGAGVLAVGALIAIARLEYAPLCDRKTSSRSTTTPRTRSWSSSSSPAT